MSIACGTDLIRISRIERAVTRLGSRFLERVFHESELKACGWPGALRMSSLAARFAAKEAVSKALGTGIWRQGVQWTDIRIGQKKDDASQQTGQPIVDLFGKALSRYQEMNGSSISISMSHDGDLALAFCIISVDPAGSCLSL